MQELCGCMLGLSMYDKSGIRNRLFRMTTEPEMNILQYLTGLKIHNAQKFRTIDHYNSKPCPNPLKHKVYPN